MRGVGRVERYVTTAVYVALAAGAAWTHDVLMMLLCGVLAVVYNMLFDKDEKGKTDDGGIQEQVTKRRRVGHRR